MACVSRGHCSLLAATYFKVCIVNVIIFCWHNSWIRYLMYDKACRIFLISFWLLNHIVCNPGWQPSQYQHFPFLQVVQYWPIHQRYIYTLIFVSTNMLVFSSSNGWQEHIIVRYYTNDEISYVIILQRI